MLCGQQTTYLPYIGTTHRGKVSSYVYASHHKKALTASDCISMLLDSENYIGRKTYLVNDYINVDFILFLINILKAFSLSLSTFVFLSFLELS